MPESSFLSSHEHVPQGLPSLWSAPLSCPEIPPVQEVYRHILRSLIDVFFDVIHWAQKKPSKDSMLKGRFEPRRFSFCQSYKRRAFPTDDTAACMHEKRVNDVIHDLVLATTRKSCRLISLESCLGVDHSLGYALLPTYTARSCFVHLPRNGIFPHST